VWPPEDAHGLAQVRGYGIPISAGENVAGVFGFRTLIEAGAIDIAQPSVTKIGGIGEMLRVIGLCQANGVEVFPHSPYFGPGFLASVHICAALIERPLVEVLWLDMEANPFDPWVRVSDGKVKVPQGPGLGCDPDPAILERWRYRIDTERLDMGSPYDCVIGQLWGRWTNAPSFIRNHEAFGGDLVSSTEEAGALGNAWTHYLTWAPRAN